MVLGIILSVVASILFGLSIVLQKYGIKDIQKFTLQAFLLNKTWMSGITVGVMGILVYVVALNMADLSTVQPVTALTLVIPVVAGVSLFKEEVGKLEWVLLSMVILGIVLVSLS